MAKGATAVRQSSVELLSIRKKCSTPCHRWCSSHSDKISASFRKIATTTRKWCSDPIGIAHSFSSVYGVHVWLTLTVEPHLRCHAEAVSRQEEIVASDLPPDHSGSPNRLWPGQRPKEESRSWHTPFGSRAYLIPFSVKFGSLALRISIQRHAAVVTARTAMVAIWRVEGICRKLRASRSGIRSEHTLCRTSTLYSSTDCRVCRVNVHSAGAQSHSVNRLSYY